MRERRKLLLSVSQSQPGLSSQDGEAAHPVAAEEPAGNPSREHQQDGQLGHSGPQQQQAERHPTTDGGHVQPQVCPIGWISLGWLN